ncbi:MAG: inorganic phosphate transporter, partial [Pseudolysinimonas sp.]
QGAKVKWGTAGKIAIGWLITIPAAGIVAALAALLAGIGFWGILADVVLALVVIAGIYLWSRRDSVTHRTFHQPQPGQFVRPKKRKGASR